MSRARTMAFPIWIIPCPILAIQMILHTWKVHWFSLWCKSKQLTTFKILVMIPTMKPLWPSSCHYLRQMQGSGAPSISTTSHGHCDDFWGLDVVNHEGLKPWLLLTRIIWHWEAGHEEVPWSEVVRLVFWDLNISCGASILDEDLYQSPLLLIAYSADLEIIIVIHQ